MARIADTARVETPEPFPPPEGEDVYYEAEQDVAIRPAGGFWALGGRLTWVAALVLALSAFTDWYAEHGLAGPTIAVIGWHTGALGKLIFFVGLVLLASDGAAVLVSFALRDWIGRRRPPLVYPEPKPLVHVPHSGSFPSGHASVAFACATVLAWKVPRLAFPAFVLAGAIAWSRVYVGVHWPLDVFGGAALGILVATALLMLSAVPRRSRRGTPAG